MSFIINNCIFVCISLLLCTHYSIYMGIVFNYYTIVQNTVSTLIVYLKMQGIKKQTKHYTQKNTIILIQNPYLLK